MTVEKDHLFRSWSSVIIPALLLLATILVFEFTDWDIAIQDRFYSPEHGWLIHFDNHNTYKGLALFYYTLPKFLLGIFGGCLLLLALFPQKLRTTASRAQLIFVIVCLVAIPCTVSLLKSHTNMPYPCKIERYGGKAPHRKLHQAIVAYFDKSLKLYKGWPGGHASGGFALMGLAFAPKSRRRRRIGFAIATAAGFFMGMGHTLDGSHFFSHNLVSWTIAWLIAALLYQCWINLERKRERRLAQ